MASPRADRSSRISFTALSRLAEGTDHEFCVFVSGRGTILSVNDALLRATLRGPGQLRGQPLAALVRKPDGKPFGTAFLAPRSQSNPQRRNFSLVTGDGRSLACRGSIWYFERLGRDPGGVLILASRAKIRAAVRTDILAPAGRDSGLIRSLPDGLCIVDPAGTIVSANAILGGMAGLHTADLAGVAPPYPWFGADDNRRLSEALAGVVKSGTPAHLLVVLERGEEPPLALSFSITPLSGTNDRFLASVRNISDVHPAVEHQMAEKRIARLREQLHRNTVRLKTLQDVNRAVLGSASVSTVFRRITQGVHHLVDHDLAGVYIFDGDEKILRPHSLSKLTPFSRRLGKFPLTLGEGIIGTAAITGETVLVNDAQRDPRSAYPPGMKPDIEHIIAAPLRGRESTYGILTVARNRDPGFHEEDALIVRSFADAASVAIDNVRLYADLRRASGVERKRTRSFRPPLPERRGGKARDAAIPAESPQAGGSRGADGPASAADADVHPGQGD